MTRGRARPNGEGSIFPRGTGYGAYVWVITPEGRRRRKYVYGTTRDAVLKKWVALQQASRRGPVATAAPTLSTYLDYWLKEIVTPNLRPKTAERYEMHVRLHIVPGLGRKRLDRLSVRDVRTWLNALATECQCCAQGKDAARALADRRCCAVDRCCRQVLSRQTIGSIRGALASAVTNAVLEELVPRNVVALAKLPPAKRRRFKPWSVDEARQFLASARADGDPFLAAYVLILVLGLRRGEVLGLAWPRVDLEDGELVITQALQRVGGRLVLADVKTEASDAVLPLPGICVAALRVRCAQQDADRLALDARWPDAEDLVFTTRYASPVEPRNFVRYFKRRCALAGVRPIRVHDTRHTCGSLLAALDVHPRVAMQILRHSKIAVTMEVYSHIPSDVTREALRKLGDQLDDLGRPA